MEQKGKQITLKFTLGFQTPSYSRNGKIGQGLSGIVSLTSKNVQWFRSKLWTRKIDYFRNCYYWMLPLSSSPGCRVWFDIKPYLIFSAFSVWHCTWDVFFKWEKIQRSGLWPFPFIKFWQFFLRINVVFHLQLLDPFSLSCHCTAQQFSSPAVMMFRIKRRKGGGKISLQCLSL